MMSPKVNHIVKCQYSIFISLLLMTAHRKLIPVTWHMISQQYYQQPLLPLVQSKSLFVIDQHVKVTQVKSLLKQNAMRDKTVYPLTKYEKDAYDKIQDVSALTNNAIMH